MCPTPRDLKLRYDLVGLGRLSDMSLGLPSRRCQGAFFHFERTSSALFLEIYNQQKLNNF